MQHVLFRADASVSMGSGHVMRCLTLANRIRSRGGRALFVCTSHPGHMASAIERHGHQVALLPSQAAFTADAALTPWEPTLQLADAHATQAAVDGQSFDWLVTDHYGLDATWERLGGRMASRQLAIDDLANRPHLGNLLLDQNLGRTPSDYAELLPAGCPTLIGPRYALLREDFAAHRAASLARRHANRTVRHVLVSMGGTDAAGATEHVLAALSHNVLPPGTRITVVMGAAAPALDTIKVMADGMPWSTQVIVNASNMAELLSEADVAIGAAGGSAWERCCLGVPSVLVVTADNQRPAANALASMGCARLIDRVDLIATELGPCLQTLQDNGVLEALSERSADLVDGLGVQRVADSMSNGS